MSDLPEPLNEESGARHQPGRVDGQCATGKQAIWSPVHVARFASGKIVEDRISCDPLGFLQQLGLIPVSEQVQ